MSTTKEDRAGWRRKVALALASAASLAALVALRGPDQIAAATVEATGNWLLSGPSPWSNGTSLGAVAWPVHTLAGLRGWQNLHVGVAWLCVVCWLFPLASSAWRGMTPLIPALLAVVLSVTDAGFCGFGLAVLVLSFWRAIFHDRRQGAATFPVAAWLAVWLAPGALPVVLAFALEGSARWSRAQALLWATAGLVAVNLTPRGSAVWHDAWVFLRWSPSAAPEVGAVVAVLLNVAVLALALRWSLVHRCAGIALGPAVLLLGAAAGQSAYLWVAALAMIPLWIPAKEQLRQLGVNVRWWAATALLVLAGLLAVQAGLRQIGRWYDLAMVRDTARSTLTRASLPDNGPVYINPQGLAHARFAGALPPRHESGETRRLAREPKLWRAQDRTARYRAVWLLGDKADYAPLARHLGESPDWRLAAVDAAGLLFVREPRTETFATEPAQQLARGFTGAANRARFLSEAALACLAAQALPEADELSRAAVRKSDLSADTAAARSLVLVSLGQIEEALASSARATALAPESPAAWQARAEALLHAGRADEAYAAGQRAAELAPGDEGALWLAARSANAARALQSEAEILGRLIDLTEGRGGDAGFYQLYLGQSYAKQGLARPALQALEKAAAAPGLSAEQRAELQEEISRVRGNAGE
jgi:tetratricopeptide (TPR) repeat protein